MNSPNSQLIPKRFIAFLDEYRLPVAIGIFIFTIIAAVSATILLGQAAERPSGGTQASVPTTILPSVITATNSVKYHTGAYLTADTGDVMFHNFLTNSKIEGEFYSSVPHGYTYTLGNWSPNGRFLAILQAPRCVTDCPPHTILVFDAEKQSISIASRGTGQTATWTSPEVFQAIHWIDNNLFLLGISPDSRSATYLDVRTFLTGTISLKNNVDQYYKNSTISYRIDANKAVKEPRVLGTELTLKSVPIGTINNNLLVTYDAKSETLFYLGLPTRTLLYSAVIPNNQWRTTSIQQVMPTNRTVIKQVATNNELSERYLTYDPRGFNEFLPLFDQTLQAQSTQLARNIKNGHTSDFILSPNGEMLLTIDEKNNSISMVSLDTNKTTISLCTNCRSISVPQVWNIYQTVEPL